MFLRSWVILGPQTGHNITFCLSKQILERYLNRPRPFSSKLFTIHNSQSFLQFDATCPMQLKRRRITKNQIIRIGDVTGKWKKPVQGSSSSSIERSGRRVTTYIGHVAYCVAAKTSVTGSHANKSFHELKEFPLPASLGVLQHVI